MENNTCGKFGYLFRYVLLLTRMLYMSHRVLRKFWLDMDAQGIPRVPRSGSNWNEREENARSIVVFLIKSCGLRYLGPSSDPIFPADVEGPPGYWTDSSPYPHIIGCHETSEACDSFGVCFNVVGIGVPDVELLNTKFNTSASDAAIVNLLALSLYHSDMMGGTLPNSMPKGSPWGPSVTRWVMTIGMWKCDGALTYRLQTCNAQSLKRPAGEVRTNGTVPTCTHGRTV